MRDKMARIRTLLANERTLLAYAPTAIMLAASGVTLIKLLYHETGFLYLGFALVLASVLVMVLDTSGSGGWMYISESRGPKTGPSANKHAHNEKRNAERKWRC